MYRLGELFKCVLKACDPHNVRLNIIMAEGQTVTPASSPDGFPTLRRREDGFYVLVTSHKTEGSFDQPKGRDGADGVSRNVFAP